MEESERMTDARGGGGVVGSTAAAEVPDPQSESSNHQSTAPTINERRETGQQEDDAVSRNYGTIDRLAINFYKCRFHPFCLEKIQLVKRISKQFEIRLLWNRSYLRVATDL